MDNFFSDDLCICYTYGMDRERKAEEKSTKENKDLKDFSIYSRVHKISKRLTPQISLPEASKDKLKTPTDPDLTYIQPFFPASLSDSQNSICNSISANVSDKPGQALLHSNSQPLFDSSSNCTSVVPASLSQPHIIAESLATDDVPPPPPVRHSSIVSSQIYQKVANNWKFDYLKQKVQSFEWSDKKGDNAKVTSKVQISKKKESKRSYSKNKLITSSVDVLKPSKSENLDDTIPVPPKRHSSISNNHSCLSIETPFTDNNKQVLSTTKEAPSSLIATVNILDTDKDNVKSTESLIFQLCPASYTELSADTTICNEVIFDDCQSKLKKSFAAQSSNESLSDKNKSDLDLLKFKSLNLEESDIDYNLHISQDADIYDISIIPKISFCDLVNSVSSNSTQQDTDAEGSITSDSADERCSDTHSSEFPDNLFSDQCILKFPDASVRPKIRPGYTPKRSNYFEKPNFLDVCCNYLNEPIELETSIVTQNKTFTIDDSQSNFLACIGNRNNFFLDEPESPLEIKTLSEKHCSIPSEIPALTLPSIAGLFDKKTNEGNTPSSETCTKSESGGAATSNSNISFTTEPSVDRLNNCNSSILKSSHHIGGSLHCLRKKLLCKVCRSFLPSISGTCKQCCSKQLGETISPEEVYCGLRLTRQVS